MYYTYILQSEKTKRYYYGHSENPEFRLEAEHNKGKVKRTKHGIPWNIIYKEPFETKSDAYNREQYFKSWAGRRWLYKNQIIIVSSPSSDEIGTTDPRQ